MGVQFLCSGYSASTSLWFRCSAITVGLQIGNVCLHIGESRADPGISNRQHNKEQAPHRQPWHFHFFNLSSSIYVHMCLGHEQSVVMQTLTKPYRTSPAFGSADASADFSWDARLCCTRWYGHCQGSEVEEEIYANKTNLYLTFGILFGSLVCQD